MKHPILSNKVRLILWWLVWFFLALGQSLLFYYAFGSFIEISIVDSLVSLLIYSGIGLSLWYPFRFFNTGETRTTAIISNLIASGALSITLWVLITKFIMTTVLPEQNNYQAYWAATFPYRVGSGVFIYGLIIMTLSASPIFPKKMRKKQDLKAWLKKLSLRCSGRKSILIFSSTALIQ